MSALLLPAAAQAQWEVEADPIAFGLSGYSAHLGLRFGAFRVDVGAFGARIPEWVHGNEGWTSKTNGVGAKLDYVGSGNGLFAGVEGDCGRTTRTFTSAVMSVTRDDCAAGGRLGYRLVLGHTRLYIAPWLGVDYTFGAIGATAAGHTFDEKRVQLFPTVHIGWRF